MSTFRYIAEKGTGRFLVLENESVVFIEWSEGAAKSMVRILESSSTKG